jgi:hypothetical protein
MGSGGRGAAVAVAALAGISQFHLVIVVLSGWRLERRLLAK